MRFAPMEIWKTACPGYRWHGGLAVQGTKLSAAYADSGSVQGIRVVGLGKGKLGWRSWQRVGCGFWGCCGCGNFGQFQNLLFLSSRQYEFSNHGVLGSSKTATMSTALGLPFSNYGKMGRCISRNRLKHQVFLLQGADGALFRRLALHRRKFPP